ncbi:hypothetical protein ACFSQ0_11385 [Mesonia sediminis]|uniref:Nucleotide-diphospho-sugar transferase domain-containing protein n=1 Tax=Mesonia sediminis TaxID=1703946 RepID=A0ABW5SFX0_9FLAO
MSNKECGFLFVANKEKFKFEALKSAKSLKLHTKLPIALITVDELVDSELDEFFDIVITNNEIKKHSYLSKIIGMQNTPFGKTVFLDSDTFVCANIDNLFDLLEMADFATTTERKRHTKRWKNMVFEDVFPEFNTGVIVYRNNSIMQKLMGDWLQICQQLKITIDMPGFREAVIKHFNQLHYVIIPEEYNLHGLGTMKILEGEVKIIHERLGTEWQSTTPYYASLKFMRKFAKKINSTHAKRLYVPYLGIVSYRYSPRNILLKIKKLIGIKRRSKTNYYKKA